jgi:hypothetical protein
MTERINSNHPKTNPKPIPLKTIKSLKLDSLNSSPSNKKSENISILKIPRKSSLPVKISISKETEDYKASPVLRKRFLELKEKKDVEERNVKMKVKTVSPSKLNYKKGDLIGSGSNAKVYLSFNFHSGKFFAVKEIIFKRDTSKEMEEVVIYSTKFTEINSYSTRNYINEESPPSKCGFLLWV